MKRMNNLGLAMLLLLATLLTSCGTPNTLRESNPNRKFTTENIQIHVRAEADWVNPVGMPPFALNSSTSFIEMIGDQVFMDLPYFGRVYFPKYSNDGMSFKSNYENLVVKPTKRGDGSILTFTTEHEGIRFDVDLTLYDGGMCEIVVTPDCASTCHYSGTWYESQLYDKDGNPVEKLYY